MGTKIHNEKILQTSWINKFVLLRKHLLHSGHERNNLLLLEPAAHHLHTNWKPMHLFGVVVLVCALRNSVELLEIEVYGKLVKLPVYLGYGEDSSAVVNLERFFYVNGMHSRKLS